MKSKLVLGALALTLLLASCGQPAASPTPTEVIPQPTATTEPAPEPTVTVQSVATFEQAPCPFDVPEGAPVECGFVVVPEDHNRPTGPKIRLSVAVLRDQSEDHQPDAVILLAGGPGEKTVQNAPSLASVLDPMHPNRDLIVFDQRGVGLSEPALECPEFLAALFDLLDEPDPNAAQRTVFDSLMACRDRLVSEGYNLSAYNTVQNAADVNAIRIALGYEQVNLVGGSYGSLLAQAVMRDHPQGIRSVVINSVLPLEKSFSVEASATSADAILRLLNACEADGACSTVYPDLQEVLFAIIERLNAEPVPITVTNPLDGQSYQALLSGEAVLGNLVTFLYLTQITPVLPQAIYNVYNGDYELMTQLSSTRLALLDLTSRGMMMSVLCTDDLIGRTPDDLLNVRAALPQQLVSSAAPEVVVEYGIFGICGNWPVQQAPASVKEPLVSDIPTLVLEGEFDPVTPPEYGQLVASYLANSYFFEFPGVGHDVLSIACARMTAGAFINDPAQMPEAACFAEMPGVVFDLPGEPEAVVLEPFSDAERGFSGLVPVGWNELQPANLARGSTALDPAYFVLEATPGTAAELFANLAAQLALDPGLQPVKRAEVGHFTWDFYTFERRGNPTDLALAEDGEKAYFVLLMSPADEHPVLYEQLFLPAVEAMAALE
ncbi:MAG: alpha/beta fold hydrolase [Anaerolineales bacterium]|nr:MAG: alpha/beta fold hydrolase [Anaerolineales bacterium]